MGCGVLGCWFFFSQSAPRNHCSIMFHDMQRFAKEGLLDSVAILCNNFMPPFLSP